jgi:hypothetical protein
MPICPYCYNMKFINWIVYHDHFVEHHKHSTFGAVLEEDEIRKKAFATPFNISGRTKKEIVEFCEENYLKEYII